MTIGLAVTICRAHAKMSQVDLAEALGYNSTSQVSEVERDKHSPSLETVEKFAEALGVTPLLLLWLGCDRRERHLVDQNTRYHLDALLAVELAGVRHVMQHEPPPTQP